MSLGKYWRNSPLVFSLVPRGQGDLPVLGQFGALISGQRFAQVPRQSVEAPHQSLPDGDSTVVVGQVNQ